MDISGVMTPASSQASRQRPAESVGVSVQDKALEVEAETTEELINSVAHQPQEVPSEKLPPHLGRNIDVTA